MTTKEQERKALNKIRTIVDELGEDSFTLQEAFKISEALGNPMPLEKLFSREVR